MTVKVIAVITIIYLLILVFYENLLCPFRHGPLTRYATLWVAHAPGMPGTFSLSPISKKPFVSDPGMHYGTCDKHVPWCVSGSLTGGGGETFPAFPAHAQPVILRIWQEAHSTYNGSYRTVSIHWADGRLTARSRKISKPRDSSLDFSNRFESWQVLRQQGCRDACQILQRYDHYNIQARGFETSSDLAVKRLTA